MLKDNELYRLKEYEMEAFLSILPPYVKMNLENWINGSF